MGGIDLIHVHFQDHVTWSFYRACVVDNYCKFPHLNFLSIVQPIGSAQAYHSVAI